jgi:3-hydroxyacyl-CoA dehydrogenase
MSAGLPPIRRVAIVGSGLIGSGWAAHFLARGLEVAATDPAPGAEARMRATLARIWPVMEKIGLLPGASPDRLRFSPDLAAAVAGAEFVQENGPERLEVKTAVFAALDSLLPPGVILASSTSGLTMSSIQSACRHPERCVVGHPFNPPYLIPLVEVVGGAGTSEDTIARTIEFYRSAGKIPIRLHREVRGHAANRLQAALWREAIHLVAEGVASVADIDAAVAWGPGLRWGVMGPHLIFHLAGGQGGMRHFMEHLAGPVGDWWGDLGRPTLTPEVRSAIVKGVDEEAGGRTIDDLEAERDEALVRLLALRRS